MFENTTFTNGTKDAYDRLLELNEAGKMSEEFVPKSDRKVNKAPIIICSIIAIAVVVISAGVRFFIPLFTGVFIKDDIIDTVATTYELTDGENAVINAQGEIKAINLDLKACEVTFEVKDGSGLMGIEYSGDKRLKPEVTFDNGKLTATQKNKQSFQGTLYVRVMALGNGTLSSLYDKSDGFYRRQLVLQVKPKPEGRVDDRSLINKMTAEAEGILLWCLEGLHRLIGQDFEFSVSDRMRRNLEEMKKNDNNIFDFYESSGYILFEKGTHASPARSTRRTGSGVMTTSKSRWKNAPLQLSSAGTKSG